MAPINIPPFAESTGVLPDVVIGHHEGLAERLRGVQPHSRVLLHCGRVLSGDGLGTGVKCTGNGGNEGPV